MIKVKTFFINNQNPEHHHRLDEAINTFLEKNDGEVVDIKYSVAACATNGLIKVYPSAMLIYKTTE